MNDFLEKKINEICERYSVQNGCHIWLNIAILEYSVTASIVSSGTVIFSSGFSKEPDDPIIKDELKDKVLENILETIIYTAILHKQKL